MKVQLFLEMLVKVSFQYHFWIKSYGHFKVVGSNNSLEKYTASQTLLSVYVWTIFTFMDIILVN